MTAPDDCPEFLKPRLRLFLSADIIGSTAQKQSRLGNRKADISWFTTIQGFYFEAQQSFRKAWLELHSQQPQDEYFGEPPVLWKTIGDEVLFTKLLSDHRQVATTIRCWQQTLDSVRQFLTKDGRNLGIKSTAWLAGFPIRNKEVVLSGSTFSEQSPIDDYYSENGLILNRHYSKPDADVKIDYIGPSIDTGFRLTSLATARKLILSVEVAYILSLTAPVSASPIKAIQLHYDGTTELKGVLGGIRYPVFWIDLSKELSASRREDALTLERHCERDAVREFCDAFFDENKSLIFPPFIEHSTEPTLLQQPDWYADALKHLIKNFHDSMVIPVEPTEAQEPTGEARDSFLQQLSSFISLARRMRQQEIDRDQA